MMFCMNITRTLNARQYNLWITTLEKLLLFPRFDNPLQIDIITQRQNTTIAGGEMDHKYEQRETVASLLRGGAFWGAITSVLVIFFEATISLQMFAPIFVFGTLGLIAVHHDKDWSVAEHQEQRWMIAGFIIAYYCCIIMKIHVQPHSQF